MAKKRSFKPNWLLIGGGLAVAWYVWKNQTAKLVSGIGGYKSGVQDKIYEYILHNINSKSYNKVLTTDEIRIRFLLDVFKSEYKWNIDSIGYYNALIEWLEGYPDILTISYPKYGNIIQDAINVGLLDSKDDIKKINKLKKNWSKIIADNIYRLAKKYNIYIPSK